MVHLANNGLSHSTIRTYISAISFVHKMHHSTDPTSAFIVAKTLQGIKNISAPPPDQRLPITINILHQLLQALPFALPDNHNHILWRSIFLLAYHACLRAGELTQSKNLDNVLQLHQISVTPLQLTIQFTAYKHSQGRTPTITIHAQSPNTPCPVTSIRQYLSIRGQHPGQLFLNPNFSPVTIQQFSSVLQTAATMSALPAHRYGTHSFRIGKATQMASDGHTDQAIQRAGRWKSSAYSKYIRPDNITPP